VCRSGTNRGYVVEHAAGASPEATIVRQVWWKRFGIWFGGLFALQGVLVLLSSDMSVWFGYLMLSFGVTALVTGWRQGVEVTDRGIETRRLARRKNRVASWPDIERFEREHAVLRDGTTMALFDWRGDAEAVRTRLEEHRLARVAQAGVPEPEA
jgi:hypothetical protein